MHPPVAECPVNPQHQLRSLGQQPHDLCQPGLGLNDRKHSNPGAETDRNWLSFQRRIGEWILRRMALGIGKGTQKEQCTFRTAERRQLQVYRYLNKHAAAGWGRPRWGRDKGSSFQQDS